MAFQILITALVVSGALMLLGSVSAAKGFALGSLFSLGNFLAMARHAPKRLGLSRNLATAESFRSLALRLALLGLPLFLAFRLPEIDVLWTVIGVFNLQLSVLIYGLVVEPFILTSGPGREGR